MTPADRAYQLVNGFRAAQVVSAAVELKIPDLVAAGRVTLPDLARATDVEPNRLRRLLRGLTALGVVTEAEDGRFANTEVGELFREGFPGSRRAFARSMVPHSYRIWEHFMETVRTGVTGQSVAYGVSLWEEIASDPDFAGRFNALMAANSEDVAGFVARSGDFSDASVVVDVGGGKGALAAGVVKVHPHLRGIVLDLPAGLTETAAYLAEHGVADRFSIAEGDFFESVPAADVYLLKDILHDWDDEHAGAILRVCRRAMNPKARIMIVERVVPSRVTAEPVGLVAVMTDLQMMVELGGRERTLEEYQPLFHASGLRFERFTGGSVYHLVEAVAL